MSKSTWSGPQRSGAINGNGDPAIGYLVLGKPFSNATGFPQDLPNATSPNGASNRIGFAATAVVERTMVVPTNAQLLGFDIDLLTAWDAAGAVTLTIGTSSAGTEYVSGVNMKSTAGRLTPTYTGTQLTNMLAVPAGTTIYATITTASGTNTAGSAVITARYIQY